ncbi:DUF4832 domain-containing protein [candidate division KSB1 bacterium]
MRKSNPIKILLAVSAVSLVMTIIFAGCGPPRSPEGRRVEYHGIRPSDPEGRLGLRNPERGFRIETLIAETDGADIWGPASHLNGMFGPGYSEQWWLLDAERYEQHGLTLAQAYCYLDRFADRPISVEKLALLQRSLNNLRINGLKAVLRFAYEKDMNRKGGPSLDRILNHLDQLTPIIRANADVIYVLQAGCVGAWGEWHNSTEGIEKDRRNLAAIVAKLLAILPPDRMTQVRVPKYKSWVLSDPFINGNLELDCGTAHSGIPAARIGFHNDGFLAGTTDGGTWPEAPFFAKPGNPGFDYMTRESAYLPVDGELFWSDQGGKLDGLKAAIGLRLHHYSSFSLAHSYSEREGKPYSINEWRRPITVGEIREAKLPESDGYFVDEFGGEVARQQFEYVRDHLGYRIELKSASFPNTIRAGGLMPVSVSLINRGFSTLHNPRPVYIALIDEAGRVEALRVVDSDADPRKWQPFRPGDEDYEPLIHQFEDRLRLPEELKPGSYRIGLWLPDPYKNVKKDANYAMRVANRNTPWWTDSRGRYGVNILGELEIVD